MTTVPTGNVKLHQVSANGRPCQAVRTLLAVWSAGRRLVGPALDLFAIATRRPHGQNA